MRDENVVLRLEGICKEFPGVKALQNVEFTLHKGEIHALMGENGAGKSTLIKVLTGVYEKDGGDIYMSDNPEPVIILSQTAYTWSRKCVTNIIPTPRLLRSSMSLNSFSTSCSSSEEVGSSRISTLQSISTARAIATIC